MNHSPFPKIQPLNLKQKTISGFFWHFIENFARLGITFIIGIILARLLSPREFGLIGMVSIFIILSQVFIDSGFNQALIRKKNCTQEDYSTVFYFNIITSLLFYLILFCIAGAISAFFNEPQLKLIVRVLGLGLVISAFAIVQRAKLTKKIDFKLQAKISLISSISSGILAIIFALKGYGVWSIIFKRLIEYMLTSILLWIWSKWIPSLIFNIKSFKEMFSFGSKLLISDLIERIYQNIYLLIIGKYFSATDLGFYSRANEFSQLSSQNISNVIGRVSYPVLSSLQDDIPILKATFKKLVKSAMLIIFISMFGMAAIAKSMVLTLIGEKWLPSVVFLQLLCFVGVFYSLNSINLNLLQVQGRSDIVLKLGIINKLIAVPFIIIGIFFGIKVLIVGLIINSAIAFFLNSYWSGKHIGYSSIQQIVDLFPAVLISSAMGVIVYTAGLF